MDEKQETEYVTVTQAAKYLGVDKETIRRYLRDNKLEGDKNLITGRWKVRMDSVEALEQGKREG
jgi:excisionase family DNA binding protein